MLTHTPSDNNYNDSIPQYLNLKTFIKTCNDSTGKALLVDGNGYYFSYDDDSGAIIEGGEVKNGVNDGIWKGDTGGVPFTELYKEGELISGESVKDGKHYHYDASTQTQSADFPGGMKAFHKYLDSAIYYPASDVLKNVQGRVVVNFTVDMNGKLNDIEIISSPSKDMADETIRVLKLSPPWLPGKSRGITICEGILCLSTLNLQINN